MSVSLAISLATSDSEIQSLKSREKPELFGYTVCTTHTVYAHATPGFERLEFKFGIKTFDEFKKFVASHHAIRMAIAFRSKFRSYFVSLQNSFLIQNLKFFASFSL